MARAHPIVQSMQGSAQPARPPIPTQIKVFASFFKKKRLFFFVLF
jgi:hypothetical protein